MDREQVIAELKRVAALLGTPSLTKKQFAEHGSFSVGLVRRRFGSWNRAVEAAGLIPTSSGPRPRPDEVYLQEIIRVTQKLGKEPTGDEFQVLSSHSLRPLQT